MKELNEFLEAKGVSAHLNQKRTLAKAFGLPMADGNEFEQTMLLRALQLGEMVKDSDTHYGYSVEVAFSKDQPQQFTTQEQAETFVKEIAKGRFCRILKLTTISKEL